MPDDTGPPLPPRLHTALPDDYYGAHRPRGPQTTGSGPGPGTSHPDRPDPETLRRVATALRKLPTSEQQARAAARIRTAQPPPVHPRRATGNRREQHPRRHPGRRVHATPEGAIMTETATAPYRRIWAELTNKCQLECVMCYAGSGPGQPHGAMSADDWASLIDQAAADGINMIQFIGGEPTMHPSFTRIMSHALTAGLDVEVYSNLVHVTDEMWNLFQSPRVSLAFSYFAPDAAAHNAVTRRPSHKATRRNAAKAAALGIPIRAGVIDFGHVKDAVDDLKTIGITKIATDRVRHIGRGGNSTPAPQELCGRCGHDVAAVSADGDVSPCIFSRWLTAGNVRQAPLTAILESPQMAAALATIPAPRQRGCNPDEQECNPGFPPSSCQPRN